MSAQSLRREATVFTDAEPRLLPSPPRHRAQGIFDGKHLRIAGDEDSLDLSGHDHLALGADPQIKQIMMESLARQEASLVVSDDCKASRSLEQALARYHFGASIEDGGEGVALTFSVNASGNTAASSGGNTGASAGGNVSLLEALGLRLQSHFAPAGTPAFGVRISDKGGPQLSIFVDAELSFAARHCIRLAHRVAPGRCHSHTFHAGELAHLAPLLAANRQRTGDGALRIIVASAVDAATGKLADLSALCRLAEEHDCLLVIDEEHAAGVIGPGGRGVAASLPDFARHRDRLLILGTLTKAFCQPGGYLVMRDAAAARLRQLTAQRITSPFIPAWIASALGDIVELVNGDFGDQRRARLRDITRRTAELLRAAHFEVIGSTQSPILAIPLRDAAQATNVLEQLQSSGFLVSIFQGPYMPVGGEMIRLAMRADLEPDDVDRLVAALVRCRDRHRPAFGHVAPALPARPPLHPL